MESELDLLRKDTPRLEQRLGADNLFVEVLKAELASMENQKKHQTQRNKKQRGLGNPRKASGQKEQ